VRPRAVVPVALLGSGTALIALAVTEGGAQLAVVVVLPVIFGQSWEFALGALLLVAGFFTFPFVFETRWEEDTPPSPESPPASQGSGGLLLIGPVPIFFGSWRNVSRRTRLIAAIAGAAVFVALVGLVFLARR
jgi:uncharacterized membrane protein